MNYTIQFQSYPERPPVKICRADTLPRVKEDISLDGESFTVLAVIHCATSPEQGSLPGLPAYALSETPVVRVA